MIIDECTPGSWLLQYQCNNPKDLRVVDNTCMPWCHDCQDTVATHNVDPYAVEIFGDESTHFLCDECYRERSDEI